MLTFEKNAKRLLLTYEPDGFNSVEWVDHKLRQDGSVTLSRTFSFSEQDLVDADTDPDVRTFRLGKSEGAYYRIKADTLNLKHDLLLWKEMPIDRQSFVAPTDISIFARIDEIAAEPIIIGGGLPGALPLEDFRRLLHLFPTTTEIKHYARARVSRTLRDYFGVATKAEDKFNKYLNQRLLTATPSEAGPLNKEPLREYELNKFQFVREKLGEMLKDSDVYAESVWQREIVDFLLLLFPKYVAVLERVRVNDYYSSPRKVRKRFIDLALVDASGVMDVVEIKKPFSNCILSKAKYRDNYTPRTELAGSVMQVEKYLFHLSKWGREGEMTLNKRHGARLPKGVEIKITNPQGLILLGRDEDFVAEQKFDFEIIRRKYANIMDIMTYDDLLRRVDAVIGRFQKGAS